MVAIRRYGAVTAITYPTAFITSLAGTKKGNGTTRTGIKKGLRKPQSLVVIPAGFKPTIF